MIAFENLEFPGYKTPKLIGVVDDKIQKLYEFHERNQRIKKMTYAEFLRFQIRESFPEEYRYILDEKDFRQFKKFIPESNPYKVVVKYALRQIK